MIAGDIALISGFVLSSVFCLIFGFTAKWWRSEGGTHIMVFTASLALIMGRLTVGALFGVPLARWEVVGIYALIDVSLAWRLLILLRTQLRRKARAVPVQSDD